ncbi:MAG: hypothetical protein HY920_05800 [Elusimicrobia bacterium]|nr:hypothetical protein [Elusimicrobiota bacterium]
MSSLLCFTAKILKHSGAIVESKNDQLEVILPANLSVFLGLDEYSSLAFSSDEKAGTLITFDSEVFKKMPGLFVNNQGRFSVVNIPPPSVRIDKLQERIRDKIDFNNAVFSVEGNEKKTISYLLAYFRYAALSDERQEGIIPVLINEFNLSTRRLDLGQSDLLIDALDGQLENVERQDEDKILKVISTVAQKIVKEELQDFIQSINRRLNRDTQRVAEYYQTLIAETKQFIERKALSREEKEKLSNKIKAIETEFKWKIKDLLSKYKTEINIEPVSFIRIEVVAPIFWLKIKRRKMDRSFPLSYNPVIKTFDTLPCESCFNPQEFYAVCDDQLHILCSQCFKACPQCGKDYCRACHKIRCPKCNYETS